MADLIKNFPKLPSEVQLKIPNGPAMAPPPGVSSNLDNPPNHTVMGIAFGTACVTVASIAIMFRIYCQTRVLKRWRVEDSIGFLAFLVYIGAATSYFLCIHFGGFLVHQWNIRYKEFQIVLQDALAITICYGIMTMFAKVAILLEWKLAFVPSAESFLFILLSMPAMEIQITRSPFLLSVAEATLVLLIFCMPAIPKGFKESPIGRGILYCLRSLASVKFSRKRCNGSAAPFENSSRHGSKLGEEFDSSSNVYLNNPERQSPGGTRGHNRSDRVIFRRVDIESQHELANVKSKAALVSNKYPWAEGREFC